MSTTTTHVQPIQIDQKWIDRQRVHFVRGGPPLSVDGRDLTGATVSGRAVLTTRSGARITGWFWGCTASALHFVEQPSRLLLVYRWSDVASLRYFYEPRARRDRLAALRKIYARST